MSVAADRLKRVVDLFTEGQVVEVGADENGPVLVWVNKLNSFEDEDCRRDGQAARAERMLEMQSGENPQMATLRLEIEGFEDYQIVTELAGFKFEEDYMLAVDDVEMDKDWREKLEYVRRGQSMLDDADVPENSERRERLAQINSEYMEAVQEACKKRQEARKADWSNMPRIDLEEAYLEEVVNRLGMVAYMEERRITELFYALRDCRAVKDDNDRWDHSKCNHRHRLLSDRSEVRTLPEEMLKLVLDVLNDVTVDRRTAGNSDAPASSSESSEPQSVQEELIPSTPTVMGPAVVSI